MAGIYNLGFIAIRREAMPILDWWAEKLVHDGDFRPGVSFTDQKVADYFPGLADVAVVKNPGWNVAYWNLHEVARHDRSALVFFHYSGFSSSDNSALSRHHEPRPRVRRRDVPWLSGLLDQYSKSCLQNNHWVTVENSGAGQPLLDQFPWLRAFLLSNERRNMGYAARPGDPELFVDWLLTPGTGVAGSPIVPPLFCAIYLRDGDLAQVFPAVMQGDPFNSREFSRWIHQSAEVTAEIRGVLSALGARDRLLPRVEDIYPFFSARDRAVQSFGVNHVAYFSEDFGIGKFSQAFAQLIDGIGIPQQKYDLPNVIGVGHDGFDLRRTHEGRDLRYSHTILGVNHDQVADLIRTTGFLTTSGKRIGYWWWEAGDVTPDHVEMARHFNEIWVGSNFIKDIFEPKLGRPVRLVPLPLRQLADGTATKRVAGFPEDKTVFFHASSLLSDPARKNPLGVLQAFLRAFSPSDGAFLELHLVDSDMAPFAQRGLDAVFEGIGDRADVKVTTDRCPAKVLDAKIQAADCFVSLHRSEGLGLNLLDAVSHGTYTIATGFGGNMDFMKYDGAALIGYHTVPIGSSPFYEGYGSWAEPDLEHAARAMQEVLNQPEIVKERAARLRDAVLLEHGQSRSEQLLLGALLA